MEEFSTGGENKNLWTSQIRRGPRDPRWRPGSGERMGGSAKGGTTGSPGVAYAFPAL